MEAYNHEAVLPVFSFVLSEWNSSLVLGIWLEILSSVSVLCYWLLFSFLCLQVIITASQWSAHWRFAPSNVLLSQPPGCSPMLTPGTKIRSVCLCVHVRLKTRRIKLHPYVYVAFCLCSLTLSEANLQTGRLPWRVSKRRRKWKQTHNFTIKIQTK